MSHSNPRAPLLPSVSTGQGCSPQPSDVRMSPKISHLPLPLRRYGFALLSVAVAVLLREFLTPLWGSKFPYLTLYPAVLVSAWYGGLGPGLATTAFGALAAAYLWLAPLYSFVIGDIADQVGLALAVLGMLLITWPTSRLWRAQEQLFRHTRQAQADTLQDRQAVPAQRASELEEESANRRRVEQHLRERMEELETLLDLLPVAVWIGHDPAGTHITGNRASYELLRMPPGSNISSGASPAERPTHFTIHRSDGIELRPADLPMQYAGMHGVATAGAEYLYRFADGTETYAYGVARPLFDAHGQVRGSLGVFMDITARKQAEDALARRARELERAHADLRQVAYVSAHDLQEPVRQLGLYAQRIAFYYRDTLEAEIREAVTFIVEGTRRMQAQFTDLMHYLEIEEPDEAITKTDCDLLVQRALAALQEPIAASGATITVGPLPTLDVNAKQLQLVFQELLDNAVKFHDSTPPQVHVWAGREEGSWRFAVQDNGIGIAPGGTEQLFGLFRKLQRRQDYPGTGMGLAICKKIIDHHGGRIWIDSQPGKGTTVYFTISDNKRE